MVVEINSPAPNANHEIFTLNFVNHPPVLTIAPAGNATTTQGHPVPLNLSATDADNDTLTFSALGGHLGYAVQQDLGLRLETSLYFNFYGRQEEWLQSALDKRS